MSTISKARKDMIDLEAITRNLEDNYHPQVIELTNYEKEQEESAVISYEELLKKKNSSNVSYDTSFINNTTVDVKKIDLSNKYEKENELITSSTITVNSSSLFLTLS